jgi:pilus assembly protein CpaB
MKLSFEKLSQRLRAHTGIWLALGALGFGAVSFYGAHDFIQTELAAEKQRLRPRDERVSIVVARRDLKQGEAVTADTMAVRQIPVDLVPGTAVRESAFRQYEGSRLAVPMKSGEPLVTLGLSQQENALFSAQVRKGVRAMTVAVDEINSISGMLRPGDHIDLIVTYRRPGNTASSDVTVALMQDVLIMATGKQVRTTPNVTGSAPASRSYTTITIEAEPVQAQRLIIAQRSGRLTAVLRNPDDRERITKRVMDLRSLDGPARTGGTSRSTTELIVGGRGSLERQQQSLGTEASAATKPSPVQMIVPTAVSDSHSNAAEPADATLLASDQPVASDSGAGK